MLGGPIQPRLVRPGGEVAKWQPRQAGLWPGSIAACWMGLVVLVMSWVSQVAK